MNSNENQKTQEQKLYLMVIAVYVWKVNSVAGMWIENPDRTLVKAAEYSVRSDSSSIDYQLARAFHIFNAPEECLNDEELDILKQYHKNFPSLSVGDYVCVNGEGYMCASEGWKKVEEVPVNKQISTKEWVNLTFTAARN